jgi:hypothetical protein
MKKLISGAVLATAIVACLSLNIQAKPLNHTSLTALSDTGKMDKMKKMDKKMDKKKTDKMKKMDKKMDKMKKDSSSKM